MSTNIENTNKTIKKEEIEDMEKRVNAYLKQGGKITEERRIYINYNTKEEYITYTTYKKLIKRWENENKPETIHLQITPIDISKDNKILPITTILDMEKRVNAYLKQGGKITKDRRIYLNINEQYEYINYEKYQEIKTRLETFRKTNNRNPNYIHLQKQTENTKQNQWYISPRYTKNKNIMKQETNYNCGPNSIQLIWYELTGEIIPETTIAKYAGTTTKGTDHTGLEKAITKIAKNKNKNINIKWHYLKDIGYEKIAELVKDKKTAIFIHNKYKNKYGHYEYIIGVNLKEEKLMINNSLSGGWIEYRPFNTMTKYINGISQKSICEVILT